MLDDLSQASHRLERNRLGPVLSPCGRGNLNHRDQTIPRQCILGHLAIPGLKYMKRQYDVWKHDKVGQWKEPCYIGKVPQLEVVVHH